MPTTPKRRTTWGGKRRGSGRPAMHEGARVSLTVRITKEAKRRIARTQRALEPQYGALATEGAAVEHLIRQATDEETE